MRPVPPAEVDPRLFDEETPNHPVCFALLAGDAAGRAVSDGTRALLHSDDQFSFASRGADAAFLDAALATLRREHSIALVTRDSHPTSTLPPRATTDRIEFPLHESIGEPPLPPGFTLRRMDAALLERCAWRSVVVAACGSVERFLEVGLGWCAMHGDEVASEAYAVFRGRTHYEIGVFTPRRRRGQGLVIPTCARLIRACSDAGYGVYWSCDASNLASRRAAEKLGFRDPRPYRYFWY